MMKIFIGLVLLAASTLSISAQTRKPSSSSKPFVVKSKQQISDVIASLQKQEGNKSQDIVAAAGTQMRIAVFHDQKRENDLFELHDGSDDIYYVIDGDATLTLGGTLTEPNEISPGEWRSKTAGGTQKVAIKKGDLIMVPRGTVHQRTVTGKGFSMILIKVFAVEQPTK